MRDPKSVLITGASSGIGAALARAYAGAGRTLLLTGRHDQRLAGVADDCRRRGAEVRDQTLDVTDAQALAAWMEAEHAAAPLELVIANAGISAGTGGAGESAQQARGTFAVNLDGVVNTVQPALCRSDSRGGWRGDSRGECQRSDWRRGDWRSEWLDSR